MMSQDTEMIDYVLRKEYATTLDVHGLAERLGVTAKYLTRRARYIGLRRTPESKRAAHVAGGLKSRQMSLERAAQRDEQIRLLYPLHPDADALAKELGFSGSRSLATRASRLGVKRAERATPGPVPGAAEIRCLAIKARAEAAASKAAELSVAAVCCGHSGSLGPIWNRAARFLDEAQKASRFYTALDELSRAVKVPASEIKRRYAAGFA